MDRTRLTRWLIPLPAILFALIPQNANAEPIPGIETTYYTIDAIPPIQSTTEYLVCGTEIENNINRNYDYELFEDCTYDLFMIHMTGFIDIPEHETIEFMLATDDGGTMDIGNDSWGNWGDQGCTWMMSGQLTLEPGSNAFNVWMYEHGGNSCMMLAWNINNEGWAIVPEEVFTVNGVPTTTSTTTSTTTTTSSTTTTTVVSTTTTSSSTTTVQETTTSWEQSTTSTIPTTTSTTTVVQTTVPVTTTTTSLPVPTGTTTTTEVVVSTTTTQPEVIEEEPEEPQETISPTTETLPESTTTEVETTIDETETTEVETSTTSLPDPVVDIVEPEVTFPQVTFPDDTVPEEIVLDEIDASTTTELPKEYTQDTVKELPQLSSTTTLPDVPVDGPVTNEQIAQILNTFVEAEPEQIVAAITQVLAAEITSDQATEIASSPEVLAAITEDQAEELFEQIDVEELTEEQLEEFTAAIQEAPTKVKKAFEKTIDIFGSQFEDYVPTGSSIPVKTRRTLVAAGALIAAIPSTRIRR